MEKNGGGSGGMFERDDKENIAKFTGCTATVVLVSATHIFCANAGDSRSVLMRKTKEVVALSDDHKPDNALEKARIESCGGFVDENRVNGSLNLSRSFGDFEYKSTANKSFKDQMVICDPDISKTTRQDNDDFILLACDGIWDCMNNEESAAMMD